MSEGVFPEPVIIPLDELRDKLALVPVDTLRQVLEPQGLSLLRADQVPPAGAIVVPPGLGKATREGLLKALDCLVAVWIGTWRPGESLQTTSVMDLMLWAAEWRKGEEVGGQ